MQQGELTLPLRRCSHLGGIHGAVCDAVGRTNSLHLYSADPVRYPVRRETERCQIYVCIFPLQLFRVVIAPSLTVTNLDRLQLVALPGGGISIDRTHQVKFPLGCDMWWCRSSYSQTARLLCINFSKYPRLRAVRLLGAASLVLNKWDTNPPQTPVASERCLAPLRRATDEVVSRGTVQQNQRELIL